MINGRRVYGCPLTLNPPFDMKNLTETIDYIESHVFSSKSALMSWSIGPR
jgi:hypothetical protein